MQSNTVLEHCFPRACFLRLYNEMSVYSKWLSKNVFSYLFTFLQVSDPDNKNTPSQRHSCRVVNQRGDGQYFQVNDITNALQVKTNKTLNYERQSTYLVTVKCTDNGDPPLSIVQNITINVTGLICPLNQINCYSCYSNCWTWDQRRYLSCSKVTVVHSRTKLTVPPRKTPTNHPRGPTKNKYLPLSLSVPRCLEQI